MSTVFLPPLERRATLSLAGIFALRMLGLFMIYPVFAVYAATLPDATPFRVGMALGIYGLAQALCQIPLGLLSDRVGRKPVIAVGLLVFAAGSLLAGAAHTVAAIAAGRLLQGAGAVGSAVLALAADLTQERNRTKAMAVIGMSIGLAFAVAVVAGPALGSWIGVPGMFQLTAGLAAVCLLLLYVAVPSPPASAVHADAETVPAMLGKVLRDGQLWRLNFGILAQHAILTTTFLGVPALLQGAGIGLARQWQVYLPALAVSALALVPLVVLAERRGHMRVVLVAAIAAIGVAQSGFIWSGNLAWILGAAVTLFFVAFNFLEAALPSLISRLAPAAVKGTALGVYSSSQFLGLFLGGVLGGWSQGRFGPLGGFAFSALLVVPWIATSWSLRLPVVAEQRLAK